MIAFVNAKINLGLDITSRRRDGYHNLRTVFLPVGNGTGMPATPDALLDVLEILHAEKDGFVSLGNPVDCPPEKNLVVKARDLFYEKSGLRNPKKIILEKHLPDGAGMGGGSADATFTLHLLNEMEGRPFRFSQLKTMALTLGADCPFFLYNIPCVATGVGQNLRPVNPRCRGYWCVIVKPDLHISTKEAFSGVKPHRPDYDLVEVVENLPVSSWKDYVKNDFEYSLFPNHPELGRLKHALYDEGAEFALMTGSGASLYGLFNSEEGARKALGNIKAPFRTAVPLNF